MDPNDRRPDAISVIFGVVQTAFYVDFFWVYYNRQRVKLRSGGIVDTDDMRNGWLLTWIFGHKAVRAVVDDEASAPALGGERMAKGVQFQETQSGALEESACPQMKDSWQEKE